MAKKKAKSLNYLEQAIADVIGESNRNSAELKQSIKAFIEHSHKLRELLHLEHGSYDVPKITAENADVVKKIIDSGLDEFSHYTRRLIMGEWPENRLVYSVLPETSEFLCTSFPLSRSTAAAEPLLEFACRSPVFIVFPKHTTDRAETFCPVRIAVSSPTEGVTQALFQYYVNLI